MTDALDAESFGEQHHRARGGGSVGDPIWLARHGWQVTAVDISSAAVERVRALRPAVVS